MAVIVRFTGPKVAGARHGTSFKGLALYLTHDPDKATTSERVVWTHTLNLAHDDIPSAVHEMLWTTRAADQLKRQNGISTGGRQVESPVKHVSLNWHPSDAPSREEMIGAVQDFLRHMGWDDRQAVLIAHNDKKYAHVHVMLNSISPTDGRSLNTGFEKVRASNWALAYERSNLRIHCTQRLKPFCEREPAPTRQAWQKLREAEDQFDKIEVRHGARTPDYFDRTDPDIRNAKEWMLLKTHQREQRQSFFVEGKQVFRKLRNQIFREVRTEYRNDWMTYFDCQRRGLDAESLGEMKADIVARQNADLEARRDVACKELRERRDAEYQQLLRRQKEERAELRERQEQGRSSTNLLDRIYEQPSDAGPAGTGEFPAERLEANFRSVARETCSPRAPEPPQAGEVREPENLEATVGQAHKVHDGASMAGGLGIGALGGLAEIAERLFDGFFSGGPARKTPENPRQPVQTSEIGGSRARQVEMQIKTTEAEAAEAERLHAWWQERRERRRDRD